MSNPGTVYLVGAGPGDPGLITVKGLDCISRADVIIYDNLANSELLDVAWDAAEKIYVGKKAGEHSMKQEDINDLIAEKALVSDVVVRLKGGDPYVFGRGAEEVLVLREKGIPFEIVPGVTAGVAAAAYAGIPVTHRAHNSVLTFVTGHEDPKKAESSIDWQSLASGGGTLVFYMGVKNLPSISERLMSAGRSADTPVALVRNGTLPEQTVVTGTLSTIYQLAKDAGITPPALIIVGDVVGLREELSWFENKPLFGKTIVVTRSRTQTSRLAFELGDLGANVLSFPTIAIEPPEDSAPLFEAVSDLTPFDWIVFTSTNAVDFFFDALAESDSDSRALAGCGICAIGSGTIEQLEDNGIMADLVPDIYTSSKALEALLEAGAVKGKHFLLPRADIASPELPEGLTKAGATVTEVTSYKTVPAIPNPDILKALSEGAVDIVTFTSSSTARNFAALVGEALGKISDNVSFVSIGPETSKTAVAEGIEVSIEAEQHDIDGLVAALMNHVTGRK